MHGETYPCDCELQRRLQRLYFAANIGREYHDICLKDFVGPNESRIVPIVSEYIDRFADNFHYGLGITLSGSLGTGKTFAMASILKELVKQGRNVYMVTFDELITTVGGVYSDEEKRRLLDKLMSVELLGLDELKSDPRNKQGFLAGALDVVIRHRTSNLLPTLVTTNMTPEEEEHEFGKAFSLLSARNQRLLLSGDDQRQEHVRILVRKLGGAGERRPIC